MSKFKAIGSLTEMEVRKRHLSKFKGDEEEEPLPKDDTPQYQKKTIVSEIYTNDHYDYLFNNGSLPDGQTSSDDEEVPNGTRKKAKKKSAIEKKREKTSQYYRLKPPPNSMIQVSGTDNKSLGQHNLQQQIAFIEEVSNPNVKDSEPIEPNAPVEIVLRNLVENANSQPNGPDFHKLPLDEVRVMSMEINKDTVSPKNDP